MIDKWNQLDEVLREGVVDVIIQGILKKLPSFREDNRVILYDELMEAMKRNPDGWPEVLGDKGLEEYGWGMNMSLQNYLRGCGYTEDAMNIWSWDDYQRVCFEMAAHRLWKIEFSWMQHS